MASNILLYLLVDLAIIIIAARAFGRLARKTGQPAVVGEIVAGIFLGPTVLGRLVPGLPARLFPGTVPLAQLADLGLVFFMFLVGLEMDSRLMRNEGRRALSISLSGVIVPFVLGALLGIPLLAVNNAGIFAEGVTRPPTALAFSLFTGAAMCITAFPVLARILIERGLYKSPLGTAVLCAAAIDDVTAWILLAVVVGITRSGSPAQAAKALLLTMALAVVLVTAGRRLVAMVARRHDSTGRLSVDQVAAIIAGLLLSAYATEWIGIHSIFGAFMFGAIMPHQSGMTRELTDKIEDFTIVVLLPVFFAVAGLRTNMFSLNNPELLSWTLLIVGVAVLGKLAGCGVAAKLTGYSTRDSLAIGTLMNTRGLTELVILTIGLGQGVLSDRTFAMMVIMALATTFMAAPIMNRIMPRKEMVRMLARGDPSSAAFRVLVSVGNPANARTLVDAGIGLTGLIRPAELLFVRLMPTTRAPEFRSGLRDEENKEDRSAEVMTHLTHQAAAAGTTARSISFLSDDVAQDLAYVAATERCDVVLLGWHPHLLDRSVARAQAQRIFRLAPCEVVLFVDREGLGTRREPDRRVLLIRTSTEDDGAAKRAADRLAENLHSDVDVMDLSGSGSQLTGVAVRRLADAAVAVVPAGKEWRDREDFGRLATEIATVAECPVLVVRGAVI
jgi:Kef-type K+ transport system membrane component KefB